MQVISSEILAEARGASVTLCTLGLALGASLWATGWLAHRFWIVLLTTASGGMLGLFSGREWGLQPLLAALLLAIAAGILALALVRVLAFLAGGLAAVLFLRSWLPAWNETLLPFLAGGLVGVLLFRVWTMALTSLAGAVVMAYSGLCLLDRLNRVDAPALAERMPLWLNVAVASVAVAGIVLQFALDRWRCRRRWQRLELERWREERARGGWLRSRWHGGEQAYREAG
ncbi:MAG: hypothetical protein NZ700_11790 [Gemmataceae bacterium]|nr:hypothetical protein [Gemmataceae bacterium]MDW8266846.1 hypothetical protein [Gemmataceae bacterium]